jgi:hypothetical protein
MTGIARWTVAVVGTMAALSLKTATIVATGTIDGAVRLRVAMSNISTRFAVLNTALTDVLITVQTESGCAVIITVAGCTGLSNTAPVSTWMADAGAFVDPPIAIIIDPVTWLLSARIDGSTILVAVWITIGAATGPVAISIGVYAYAIPHLNTDGIATNAIIIEAIITDLGTTSINQRVTVITIDAVAGSIAAIAISVVILIASIWQPKVLAITVLINIIEWRVTCSRIDKWVVVVTVRAQTADASTETISVIIGTIRPAGFVSAVAVLVDVVAADLWCPRVSGLEPIVTIRAVASGPPPETVLVVVHAIHHTGRVTIKAVLVDAVAADFDRGRVDSLLLVIAIAASQSVSITFTVLIPIGVAVGTCHLARRVAGR